jgi:hypothetical protein
MKHNYLLLPGLLPAVAGCITLHKIQPAEFIPTHSPDVVWVTTNDNVRTPVGQPQIIGDSLKGTRQDWPQLPVAISLKEINYMQASLVSPTRTALLVTVVGASVAGLVYAIATSDKVSSTTLYHCAYCKGSSEDVTGEQR